MRSGWAGALRRAARDRRGVSTVIFAVTATAFIGMAGLATQAGLWYADYAQMQTAADAASTAGAVAISASESTTQSTASASYVLSRNGYVNNQNGVSVTVNIPPRSGAYRNNADAVEVLISKTASLTVAGLFLRTAPTLRVRSVALYGATATTCVLALGRNLGGSNTGQFTLSGGAVLNSTGCAVATNSTAANAFYLYPSPTVKAETIISSGGVASSCGQGPTGCGNNLQLSKPYAQDHVPTTDPLAATQNVPLPADSNFTPVSATCTSSIGFPQWNSAVTLTPGTVYCPLNEPGTNTITFPADGGTYTFTGNVSLNGSVNIAGGASSAATTVYINGALNLTSYNPVQMPPGTYYITGGMSISTSAATTIAYDNIPSTFYINGNLTLSGSAQVDVPPGTYFIYNGNLNVGNGTRLTCSSCVAGGAGASFVLMGNAPGIVNISGSAPVIFSAPASSNYNSGLDGIAIYEPPGDTGTNLLAGSGTLTIQGAFYAPDSVLNISGAAGTSSSCAVIVTNTITMTGSGFATSTSCSSYGYGWTAGGATPNGVTIVE